MVSPLLTKIPTIRQSCPAVPTTLPAAQGKQHPATGVMSQPDSPWQKTEAQPVSANDNGVPVSLGTADGFTGTLYCGRFLGISAMPGTNGRCGPHKGSQCPSCQRLQTPEAVEAVTRQVSAKASMFNFPEIPMETETAQASNSLAPKNPLSPLNGKFKKKPTALSPTRPTAANEGRRFPKKRSLPGTHVDNSDEKESLGSGGSIVARLVQSTEVDLQDTQLEDKMETEKSLSPSVPSVHSGMGTEIHPGVFDHDGNPGGEHAPATNGVPIENATRTDCHSTQEPITRDTTPVSLNPEYTSEPNATSPLTPPATATCSDRSNSDEEDSAESDAQDSSDDAVEGLRGAATVVAVAPSLEPDVGDSEDEEEEEFSSPVALEVADTATYAEDIDDADRPRRSRCIWCRRRRKVLDTEERPPERTRWASETE